MTPVAPLRGALIGTLGAAIYWLAAQIWPSSVAVILAMTLTALMAADLSGTAITEHSNLTLKPGRQEGLSRLFCLLIKYNALMALSAAKLPFAAPANLPLGLIMICGYAASFAIAFSVLAARPQKSAPKVTGTSVGAALLIGFAPAALLGIPGLTGLAAAIGAGLGFIALLRAKRAPASPDSLGLTQLSSEACFYLGALATWRYV